MHTINEVATSHTAELLQQANSYLTLGTEVLFKQHLSDDYYNVLLVLQHLFSKVILLVNSDKDFMTELYQLESLGRIVAHQIFLESETGDKVNYLVILSRLLEEAREEAEAFV